MNNWIYDYIYFLQITDYILPIARFLDAFKNNRVGTN
jgi:hypothetical protein